MFSLGSHIPSPCANTARSRSSPQEAYEMSDSSLHTDSPICLRQDGPLALVIFIHVHDERVAQWQHCILICRRLWLNAHELTDPATSALCLGATHLKPKPPPHSSVHAMSTCYQIWLSISYLDRITHLLQIGRPTKERQESPPILGWWSYVRFRRWIRMMTQLVMLVCEEKITTIPLARQDHRDSCLRKKDHRAPYLPTYQNGSPLLIGKKNHYDVRQ